MEADEVIAFIFAGLLMAWAFRSAAYAFSGGTGAGLHEVAPPIEEQTAPSPEDLEASYQRRHRFHQLSLYVAGFAVTGAIIAMLIGSLVA